MPIDRAKLKEMDKIHRALVGLRDDNELWSPRIGIFGLIRSLVRRAPVQPLVRHVHDIVDELYRRYKYEPDSQIDPDLAVDILHFKQALDRIDKD